MKSGDIRRFSSLDEVVSDIGAGETITTLISLTGFGGHEQMLLKHMERSRCTFEIIALSDVDEAVESLRRGLPRNCHFIDRIHCPAYPLLRSMRIGSMLLKTMRAVHSLAPINLVSTGDIGNHYLFRLMLRLRQGRSAWTYVPMPPARLKPIAVLGRFATPRLLTISAHEASKFWPRARNIIPNLAPGHLNLIGMQQLPGSPCEIYWIGRLEAYQKQPQRALEVIEAALADGVNCRLNFVGDGSEREQLAAIVAERGLTPKVKFWGWVDFAQAVLPQMPPIGILLNTSDFEGLPLTMLDAFELRVPCIVRSGAITDPEIISKLIIWQTPQDAAQAIIRLQKKRFS